MSVQTIDLTIEQTLPESVVQSYGQHISAVTEALLARESQIKDALREFAVNKGLSDAQVSSLFVEVGLDQPEPEVQTPVEERTSIEARLSSLEGSVQQLVTLANRHLRAGI